MGYTLDTAFPSRFLRAADIVGHTVKAQIQAVTMEEFDARGGGKEHKLALWFVGKEKGMTLNKTNAEILFSMLGSDTDEWTGKTIAITTTKVRSPQGGVVDGLTVVTGGAPTAAPAPAPQPQAAPAPAPQPQAAPDPAAPAQSDMDIDPNDDIPW